MNAPTHQSEGTSRKSIRSKNPNSVDKRLPSIDTTVSTSIDSHSKPQLSLSTKNMTIDYDFLLPDEFGIFRDQDGHARAMDGRILQVFGEDIADIVQLANGVDNVFTQQRSIPNNNPTVPDGNPRANTTGIGSHQSCRPVGQASINKLRWEQKDEYGVYRDESGHARSAAGDMILVTKDDLRKILERASLFGEGHIYLPEHATSFKSTKLAPEIYTKDEINEMVTGICGAQEKLGEELKTLVDDTYQPLDRGYNQLFRCMAEMRTEIESMQHNLEKEATTSPSIDANKATSIDVKPQTSQIPAEPKNLAEKKDEWEIAYINTRINNVYNPLNNNVDWLSTRIDLLQQELDTIRMNDPHVRGFLCRLFVLLIGSFPFLGRELGSRDRTQGITCALKSTGVAHSQQAPLRQDPVPLILLSWVPLKPELILNLDDEAGILILSCVQAGVNQRDDAGNGLFKVFVFSGNTLFLLILYSEPSRMTDGFDLVLGSSSIGTRVHSRHRVGNEVYESMDSSSSSLDLTSEIEELRNATAGEALLPPGGDRLSPVDPLSIIGVEEVANWRRKFRLSDDVTIRIPGPIDRVSDLEPGEIPIYEGFFESGFRDQIPSLVAEISKAVRISPGQLNPTSWRTLIAIQNLGDLEGFAVGITEVLYCYSISPLNGGEFRYHLRPRGKALPVWELSKAERKRCPVFEGHVSRLDYPSGRDTIEQLLELPLERWVISGSRGNEALAEYKKALQVMSARKAVVKRIAPVEDEEVQFVGSCRRRMAAAVAPSSSKKRFRDSGSVPRTPSPASFDWSAVFSNLNAKVFPSVPAHLSLDGDSFAALRSLQGDLLQAASQLFHLGERMEDKTTAKAEVDALTAQLREGKGSVLTKEKEIRALKLTVQNQEEAMERVTTENASMQKQLEDKEEDICEWRYAAEVFDTEKAMAANGAKVVVRWELMREWLRHQTDSWEPAAALEQYKTVKTTEAELLGLPVPCFDDEPQVPETPDLVMFK
ncbi:hypothetical protein F2Q68_00016714 [Brassica cretica]|uniref:Uncharacterized protein n=1 Tax=Brassica cretica TaxID=69181 RepID=A0A8S9HDA8_BRACR|nr:hypothetical protein F2Q68_00016714 [Brassica cretica]